MTAAGSTDESFLPQIIGIFYAVFDPLAGPIVTHQVPESLISTGANDVLPPPSLSSSAVLPTPANDSSSSTLGLLDGSTSPLTRFNGSSLRRSSGSIGTPSRSRRESPVQNIPPRFQEGWSSSSPLGTISRSPSIYPTPSPFAEAPLSPPTCLIDFPAISEYIIPRQSLTHRLVTCTTDRHKVLGFPCVVRNAEYDRNEFRWNLCFVFNRRGGRDLRAGWYNTRESDDDVRKRTNQGEVDLSAFESVVRKCGRILRGCEVESRFLSSPDSSWKMHSIIEQLFEDLNSYSETSIQIDQVNNLELKLFPFFPNPPEVESWHVPIALVDLVKIKDANWDLLVTRIIPHINGINHVARIAELADADDDLTRLCIEHLLFYQVIMMQDVFQFSNVYTVKPSIQRIIKDKSVREECGNYVTIPSHQPPSWPMLLDLYSRLLCGKTVLEWAEDNSVFDLGIDLRRFVSFGIIKGFLRRVHRWPMFDRTIGHLAALSGIEGLPETDSLLPIPTLIRPGSDPEGMRTRPVFGRQESEMTVTSGGPSSFGASAGLTMRRPDERTNESVITLRSMGSAGSTGTGTSLTNPGGGLKGRTSSNENALKHPGWNNTLTLTSNNVFGSPPGTSMPPIPTSSRAFGSSAGGLSTSHTTSGRQSSTGTTGGGSGLTGGSGFGSRARGGRSSIRSTTGESPGLMPPTAALPSGVGGTGKRHEARAFYDALGRMLDGQHHTDEIQVRFGISWEKLEECLIELGGLGSVVGQAGKDRRRQLTDEQRRRASRGDYGRIKVVLR